MNNHHLFPFLWMRGEDDAAIREEIEQIYSAGIREFCVESRPHPDFMGENWFSDMELVLEEAEKRSMRVWVLDDRVFPTGYANGLVAEKYPQYLRKYMKECHIDAFGPLSGATFHFDLAEEEQLIAVVAIAENCPEKNVVLTEAVRGQMLYWDVPEGLWRVFFLIETRQGGKQSMRDYLNPLVADATRVLLEAVYEPHFRRFEKAFGNTFAGFFSDEPQFGNVEGYFWKKAKLGTCPMVLPYCDSLREQLSNEWGSDFTACLPLLFQDIGNDFKRARYCYMNVVTRLYAENFSGILGKWCREHGVEYVGHVIEDDGAHTRLGAGAGHFFRALSGQSYAGIDVVLRQILPGRDTPRTRSACGSIDSDGVFFHYTLAKLGSSLGHLNPDMQGRAFCEIFGAYGWSEGLKLMKWLVDFMLVRGINYFVPHAYSPKEFPDPDCPPHFYAKGKNPQYRYFNLLAEYMERASELFSGGVHRASAAVLYHAEADWYSLCMPVDIPARELSRAQIDFDIVWADVLCQAEAMDGKLVINNESFGTLIVPQCEALPYQVLQWIAENAAKGFPIFFVESFPNEACDAKHAECVLQALRENCRLVSTEDLTEEIQRLDLHDILLKEKNPWVRFYRYQKDGADYYMFFNEHPYNAVETQIYFRETNSSVQYDVLNKRKYRQKGDVILKLAPYESVVYVFGTEEEALEKTNYGTPMEWEPVWNISKAEYHTPKQFEFYRESKQLENLGAPHALPHFSGVIRYQTSFFRNSANKVLLDLGAVYETATVRVNGICVGTRICPPYTFELNGLLQGENCLEIEVVTTLANAICDPFSRTDVFEPIGLMGPVCIREEQK